VAQSGDMAIGHGTVFNFGIKRPISTLG
jgi:hypothetical protein